MQLCFVRSKCVSYETKPSLQPPPGGFLYVRPFMTANIAALKADNLARWSRAKATRDFSPVARRLFASKARYQAVSARASVPWHVIAVIHERECSQSWIASD